MGLLIAFIAGAACATLLWHLSRRGQTAHDDGLLAELRSQLAEFDGAQREMLGRVDSGMRAVLTGSADVLRSTGQLSAALRRPGIRGRWGELTLQNVVEAAGLSEHVDFDTQVHISGEDESVRPDMVINLPGGGHVAVDSKVPLDAFMDANEVDDPEVQEPHLQRHVQALRTRAQELGAKSYWRRFRRSPEMVVMFVASEAAFAAAAQRDSGLIEDAARRRVVIATPATMIALLQVVALGWREAALSEGAERIRALGVEIAQRLGSLNEHFARQGKALDAAVRAHNAAMGSYESRVLVTARRLGELGVADAQRLDEPQIVATAARLPAGQPEDHRQADATLRELL